MTDAVGPYALAIENFWWFAFTLLTAVYIIVLGALAYAVWHRRGDAPSERRIATVVGSAVGITALILIGYLVVDLSLGRAVAAPPDPVDPLYITVTGHQWWWEIQYEDSIASRSLKTANELHIPVGRDVRIRTRSADVIHSFWIPQLHGKRDLIPGDTAYLWLRADRAGIFRGQCAEFCGHQHAKMGLYVVAHAAADFDAWYDHQLQPAARPVDSLRAKGLEVFIGRQCVMCHSIRGTLAGGSVAPDLTHVASRATIAAGTRPNTRGWLAGWILDPQSIKPGAKMPPNAMSGIELQALLAYLEGLH